MAVYVAWSCIPGLLDPYSGDCGSMFPNPFATQSNTNHQNVAQQPRSTKFQARNLMKYDVIMSGCFVLNFPHHHPFATTSGRRREGFIVPLPLAEEFFALVLDEPPGSPEPRDALGVMDWVPQSQQSQCMPPQSTTVSSCEVDGLHNISTCEIVFRVLFSTGVFSGQS